MSGRPRRGEGKGLRCKIAKDKSPLGLNPVFGSKQLKLFESPGKPQHGMVNGRIEDTSPEIRIEPIPLNFDDSPGTGTKAKSKKCRRLDIPSVYHILKSDLVRCHSRRENDILKSTKDSAVRSKIDSTSKLEEHMNGLSLNGSPEWSTDRTSEWLWPDDYDECDEYLDLLLKSLISDTPDTSTSTNESFDPPPPANGNGKDDAADVADSLSCIDLESEYPWFAHAEIMNVAVEMSSFDFENDLDPSLPCKRRLKPSLDYVMEELGLNETQLRELNIYSNVSKMLDTYHSIACNNTYSDFMKHLGFSYWQRGELDKCIYAFSESHGTYLRTDIIDKHNLHFCRADEHSKTTQVNKKLESIKADKFQKQSHDVQAFGRNSETFYRMLSELNPEWNVIQLTSMIPFHNRFSNSITKECVTPALFLTCFTEIPGYKSRQTFMTYIPEPVPQEGSGRTGIMDEFKKVMLKNRTINDRYTGDRRQYWDIRSEHNAHLESVTESMQEEWLSPWYFLLPGNLVDSQLRVKIGHFIRSMELAMKFKFSSYQQVAMSKLIENYCYLREDLKLVLPELLACILGIEVEKIQVSVINKLVSIASKITIDDLRKPTILIIDQAVEQLPWDWIRCLRQTTVSRNHSFPILYSLMNLANDRQTFNKSECTFVVNPDLSLKSVQNRLEMYLKSRNTWDGHVGKKPSYKELEQALQTKDLFIYCGHGSGQCLFPDYLLQKIHCRAIPILMGCGSAQYKYYGPKSYSSSIVNSYCVASCPSVVGFLWEVTDVECDRITVELLERWVPGNCKLPEMPSFDSITLREQADCLASAVRAARVGATQFLTQAGLVNYGVPIKRFRYTPH